MLEDKEMRQVYCEEMIKLAEKNDKIIILEADLANSTGTKPFEKAFPDRFIDVGIAEANMVGVAAGLASCGKLPFCHSFTPFMTRRCLDQIAISVCYSKLNVKLVGTDPGIMATNNGGTHMSLEDIGLMRSIPQMVVFEPCDCTVLKKSLPQLVDFDSSVYVRLFRKKPVKIFDDSLEFDLFKATEISRGNDAVIIASGIMVAKALEAAQLFATEGKSVGVLCVHTIKPLDEQAVISAAKFSGAVVTAENHNIYNGLGSAVCEVLSEKCPMPVERVGIKDRFGEVGNENYLAQLMEIDVKDIIAATRRAIERKGNSY